MVNLMYSISSMIATLILALACKHFFDTKATVIEIIIIYILGFLFIKEIE